MTARSAPGSGEVSKPDPQEAGRPLPAGTAPVRRVTPDDQERLDAGHGPSARPDSVKPAHARPARSGDGGGDEASGQTPATGRGRPRQTMTVRRSRFRFASPRVLGAVGLGGAALAGGSAGVVLLAAHPGVGTAVGAVATVYIAALTTHRAIKEQEDDGPRGDRADTDREQGPGH